MKRALYEQRVGYFECWADKAQGKQDISFGIADLSVDCEGHAYVLWTGCAARKQNRFLPI